MSGLRCCAAHISLKSRGRCSLVTGLAGALGSTLEHCPLDFEILPDEPSQRPQSWFPSAPREEKLVLAAGGLSGTLLRRHHGSHGFHGKQVCNSNNKITLGIHLSSFSFSPRENVPSFHRQTYQPTCLWALLGSLPV